MNNKFKLILKRGNLNFTKELIVILLINLLLVGLMIVVYIFSKNNIYFIPFIFLIVLTNAVAFYRYLFLYSKNLSNQIKEFTYLLRYLYLDINNQIKVKPALLALKEKASLKMGERLDTLYSESKEDASLVPFLNFAANFSSVLIEEVMLNLYRYSVHSHKDNLHHFNEAYFKLKKSVEEDEEKDSNRLYEFVKSTAIIGTALIVILVIIVTIMIVEQFIYG